MRSLVYLLCGIGALSAFEHFSPVDYVASGLLKSVMYPQTFSSGTFVMKKTVGKPAFQDHWKMEVVLMCIKLFS